MIKDPMQYTEYIDFNKAASTVLGCLLTICIALFIFNTIHIKTLKAENKDTKKAVTARWLNLTGIVLIVAAFFVYPVVHDKFLSDFMTYFGG